MSARTVRVANLRRSSAAGHLPATEASGRGRKAQRGVTVFWQWNLREPHTRSMPMWIVGAEHQKQRNAST